MPNWNVYFDIKEHLLITSLIWIFYCIVMIDAFLEGSLIFIFIDKLWSFCNDWTNTTDSVLILLVLLMVKLATFISELKIHKLRGLWKKYEKESIVYLLITLYRGGKFDEKWLKLLHNTHMSVWLNCFQKEFLKSWYILASRNYC